MYQTVLWVYCMSASFLACWQLYFLVSTVVGDSWGVGNYYFDEKFADSSSGYKQGKGNKPTKSIVDHPRETHAYLVLITA